MSRVLRRSALVAVPAERMFAVIDRVEDYAAFLPWFVAAHDVKRSDAMVAATVEVGWKHLHFKVRTRNPKTPPERMEIHLEDGSFRHFSGLWELKPLGSRGCRVEFTLSYELAVPGAERVAGSIIDHAADRMVDAFIERAESRAALPSTPAACQDASAQPEVKEDPRRADDESTSAESGRS